MTSSKFLRCAPLVCAALMLAACGGEGGHTVSEQHHAYSRSVSVVTPIAPEPSIRPMRGLRPVEGTSHANAALEFLSHSIGSGRLMSYLGEFAAAGDDLHREAAQKLQSLLFSLAIDGGAKEVDPSPFFASLQKLPAFSSLNAAGELEFPIVGAGLDIDVFLTKLSQSFALHKLYANMALKDDNNALKTAEQYWTVLRPAGAQDSLQAVFDRTDPALWQLTPANELRQLTVRMANASQDGLDHRNFDFNQNVLLKTVEGNRTTILTLEPREVIEFAGTGSAGQYVTYGKNTDQQWSRFDNQQGTVLDRMPALEKVRWINFAIKKIESTTVSGSPTPADLALEQRFFGALGSAAGA